MIEKNIHVPYKKLDRKNILCKKYLKSYHYLRMMTAKFQIMPDNGVSIIVANLHLSMGAHF